MKPTDKQPPRLDLVKPKGQQLAVCLPTNESIMKIKLGTLSEEAAVAALGRNPFEIFDTTANNDPDPEDIPAREWAWDRWLPFKVVTGMSGSGGAAKSLLAQELCTMYVLSKPFLGSTTQAAGGGRAAIYMTTEDDTDEGARRQAAINAAHGVHKSELENLHRMSMVGEIVELVNVSGGSMVELPLLKMLKEKILSVNAGLVVLDLLPDYWNGSEIDRQQVNKFVKVYLAGLAKACNCAILVLYHPSKAGIRDGTGSSGSTAWDGSFRSRWYLTDIEKDGVRRLARMKANYSAKTQVYCRWENWHLEYLPDYVEGDGSENKYVAFNHVGFWEFIHAVLSDKPSGEYKFASIRDDVMRLSKQGETTLKILAGAAVDKWDEKEPYRFKNGVHYTDYWATKGSILRAPVVIHKSELS